MVKVNVYITLKKEILDTQGLVIKKAIPHIGFDNVENVRVGKFIQMEIRQKAGSDEEIRKEIEYLCDRLLSNPIIEDFKYEIL